MKARLRSILAGLFLVVAVVIAARQLDGFYPIRSWLFWPYLYIWALCAVFALACMSAGHLILRRLFGWTLPLRTHLLFSFATGVLAFALGIFLIGLAHGLYPVTFVAWPLLMIAVGGPALWRDGRRVWRLVAHARRQPRPRAPWMATAGMLAVFALGALAIVALYLNILTPHNTAYDARWAHLGMAEHYAADHAIRRFPEGWFPGTLPHLASLIYTWAFMLPGGTLFLRIELAAHLEMVLFLATLAGVPLLVRWLLRGVSAPMSWAAVFLFPGIFVYDGTLSAAADHVLAFWGVPIFLALGRFWRIGSRRDAGLLAAMLAAAALTKYQSLYMVIPVVAVVFARIVAVVWRAWSVPVRAVASAFARTVIVTWRARSVRSALASAGVFAGVFLAITSIHWLKNIVWYGDPMYPMMHASLHTLRPWNIDAEPTFHHDLHFKVEGTLDHRALESAKSVATFGFKAHDWPTAHGDWPVVGFLFTMLLPFALLFDRAWRLRALAAAAAAGVFLWYWTFHQDRYLQALVPWMAAFVAAVLWRLWQSGWILRGLTVLLVGLQVVWGGDHYFLPSHAMCGMPLKVVIDLLASGFTNPGRDRYDYDYSGLTTVGKTLPRDARVLIHEEHLRLGVGRPALSDARGSQGAISLRRMESPRATWELFRSLGVTHLLWMPMRLVERWENEAVFFEYATRYLDGTHGSGGTMVGALRATPPPDRPYGPVAILGCQVARRVSLVEVDDVIGSPNAVPSTAAEFLELEKDVGFIFIESACRSRLPTKDGYDLVTRRNGWETWARRN